MSFEYGSKQIQIKNPFSFQGRLVLINGALFLILGIVLFFIIGARSREIIAGQGMNKTVLLSYFFAALALTSSGIFFIAKGLFMVNKFYVGRGMPADLAWELTKTQSDYEKNPHSIFFEAHDLDKALQNRINPSFLEPSGLLSRLLHTFNPRLIYLPLQLRFITQSAFECAVYTIGILLLFVLSILSGVIGINEFTSTPIWKYIGWIYVMGMLYLCYSKFPRESWKLLQRKPSEMELVFLIAFAILVPVFANFADGASELSASPLPLLIGFTLFSAVSFAYIYFLALQRIPEKDPRTEVSEFREQWEESVNPQEIFRNVDMTLANYRYMEMSNRIYRNADTGLISYEKGEYSGSMIQETQPVPLEEINNNSLTSVYKKFCAYAAQTLIVISGLWLFYMILMSKPETWSSFQIFSNLVGMSMLVYFGFVLYNVAHTYFGEIRFKSHLIHFFADGTFNKSKISTGMSVYDSMRSENEIVQSSIRPWIVCAEIETTTFAVSGAYNLEQYRTILEFHRDDKWLDDITNTLKSYLRNRRKIANTVSASDLESTGRIAQINQVISSGHSRADDSVTNQIEHKIAEIMSDDVKKDY